MKHYPILFSRRDQVKASRYTAGVIVSGRILVTEEDGEFWAEGVSPGGMAAKGESLTASLKELCAAYREILLDIAQEEPTFESFKKATEQFFADTNIVALGEWESAVLEVRAGNLHTDDMTKRPSESPIGMKILLLEEPPQSVPEMEDEGAPQSVLEVDEAAMAA